MMRFLLVLALIFCFGCDDDSAPVADAAVEVSVQEAAVVVEVGVPEAAVAEVGVDLQLDDVAVGEAAVEDAQSE